MKFSKRAITSAVILGSASGLVFSQESNNSLALEEVVVTAQKRSQSIQDIGISISSFDANSLKELKVEHAADVANYVSNVQVQTGFGQPYFAVRGLGINEFSGNTDSPVAIHMDDVYLSKAAQATMASFDIERIEVLKGPQGTLFGRNTTGGSVNIITNKPSQDFSAGLDVTAANYQRVDLDGHINGAITETVSGRFSFTRKKNSEGIVRNTFNNDRIGGADSWAARAQLLWEPSDTTQVLFSYTATQDDSQPLPYGHRGAIDPLTGTVCSAYADGSLTSSTPGCSNFLGFQDTDNDPFTVNTNKPNQLKNEGDLAVLKIEQDVGGLLLTSVTGYSTFTRDHFEDTAATPSRYAEINWYNDIEEFTQEIRLNSDSDGDLNWVAGLYYQYDEVEVVNSLASVDLLGLFRSAEYTQKTEAAAIFGQFDYAVSDDLEFILGLRYSRENKELEGRALLQPGSIEPLAPKSRLTSPNVVLVDTGGNPAEIDDSDISWKLGVNYHPNEETLTYASITKGFKSGGFEGGFPSPGSGFNAFDAEEITAYDVGVKTYLLDRTLSINAAAFHYDYKNAQVNADIPSIPIPVTTNAEGAQYDGAEIDLWWRPAEGLDVKVGVGYLDGVYGEFSSGGVSQAGNTPVNSPEFTATSLLRYEKNITDNMNLILLADVKWTDDKFLESSNSLVSVQESYALFGGRVSLESISQGWNVSLWGKNLGNEEYLTYVNDLGPTFGFVLDIYGLPRTFGLSVSKSW